MHNVDRGMIKWIAFDSVMPSKNVASFLANEKENISMPILSDEQILSIEENLIKAFYNHENINVKYFYNGKILSINSKIKKIDFIFKKIYFNNKVLLFDQIIEIIQ